ncbi:MAG: hypothetical protein Q8O89_01875 [Nanoarchaeota archaeon]|nr:hypothetical protein [Nanoarchaeota archaeon]
MKKIIIPGVIAGVAMLVLGLVLSQLLNLAIPSLAAEYQNANLFRAWTDPLMMIYFAYPIILGIILAGAWHLTKGLIKVKGAWKKGLHFGLALWIISNIPGMIITYSSFKVSLLMVLSWSLVGLLQGICAGTIFAKMNK